MKKQAIILDLDGTAFITHPKRQAFLEETPKNWDAFFDNAHLDSPNERVVKDVKSWLNSGKVIIVMTTRTKRVAPATIDQIRKLSLMPEKLLMRDEGDYSPEGELKGKWVDELSEDYEFVGAYDDCPKNIAAFEQRGIKSWLVADGKPCYGRGEAPKAGKGLGIKQGQKKSKLKPKTKVVSVRLPEATIQERKINTEWLLDAVALKLKHKEQNRKDEYQQQLIELLSKTVVENGEEQTVWRDDRCYEISLVLQNMEIL